MKKIILSILLAVVVSSKAEATTYNLAPQYINNGITQTGVLVNTHPIRVGLQPGQGYGRSAVLVFALPRIPFGETVTGATFSATVAGVTGTFTFNGDLYSLGILAGGTLGGTQDYYQGTFGGSTNPNFVPLQQGFLTPSTLAGKVSASASGNAAIASDFQNALDAGATIGDSYLISLNPNFTTAFSANLGWDVGGEQDAGKQPTLSITTAQAPQCGRVLIEYWENMSPAPTSIASFTGSANYPNKPSAREFAKYMETPPSLNAGSGDRLRGYFHVPVSGSYTFAIAGSDAASLLFSTDSNPAHALQIAATSSAGYLQWNAAPGQIASPIALTAGQVCYIEAIHETNAGSTASCMSIGCQGPTDSAIALMPITNVAPYDTGAAYSAGAIANALQSQGHPRLMISDAIVQRMAYECNSNTSAPYYSQYYKPTQFTNWGKVYDACVTTNSSILMPNGDARIVGPLINAPVIAAPSSSNLLATIRTLQDRVYLLSLFRQIEKKLKPGDTTRISDAATQIYNECHTASLWSVWGTQGWDKASELELAEMSNALAIAYDWNYDAWSKDTTNVEPQFFVNAINKQILAEVDGASDLAYPGVNQLTNKWYFNGVNPQTNKQGFQSVSVASGNWPIVCNSGVLMGAMAIIGDESAPYLKTPNTPQAATVIDTLMPNLSTLPSFQEWANDGGWNEGMNYWNFAVRYLTSLYACLETTSGTCFGVDRMSGMSSIGAFPMYMNGPSGNSFNFSDGPAASYIESACQYFGLKYNQPVYSYPENQTTNFRGHYPTDMIWYDPRQVPPGATVPTSAYFSTSGAISLRTDWTSNALFVGMKAGYNCNADQTLVSPYGSTHEDLQLGTFVFEALGVRWAEELGPDTYYPYYFDNNPTDTANRWQYYRCRSEGSNTLVLNPSPDGGQYAGDGNPFANVTPNSGGNSSVTKFVSNATTQEAVIDMTSAYTLTNGYPATTATGGTVYPAAASTSVPVTGVLRGIRLTGGVMQVQDEITASATVPNVYWFMHTTQTVGSVTSKTLVLSDSTNTNHVLVTIQSPASASFIPTGSMPVQPMAAAPLATSPNPTQINNSTLTTPVRKIYIYLPSAPVGTTTITVSLAPYTGTSTPPANPSQVALSSW